MSQAPANNEVSWSKSFTLLVALAGFMELFDGTVLQTALPAIGRDFGVSADAVAVTMAGYFAAVAGVIPLCTWIANRMGVRNAFATGVALFAIGSALSGMSAALTPLLVFRVIQGVGGAIMMTVGQLGVLRTAPKAKMLNVTAYLIWPALAAPVVAPLVGGLITENLGWRWLFWVNIPLSLIGVIWGWRQAPRLAPDGLGKRLDVVGAVLLATGLCTLIPALGLLNQGVNATRVVLLGLGFAATAAAVVWLLRAKNPLLDLRIYRIESFRASNFTGAIYRGIISAIPVIITLQFQTSFGWSAVQSGLVVTGIFVGNIGIKPFANYTVRRWGFRAGLTAATLVGSLALALAALVGASTPLAAIFMLLIISGAARSLGFTSYIGLQYADVPSEQMGSANPLSSTAQQLATALGIAGCVGLLAILQGWLGYSGFNWTLAVMAFALAYTLVPVRRLPRNIGSQVAVK
jgi:EmrB/QacA subfamily drug resistance transporter